MYAVQPSIHRLRVSRSPACIYGQELIETQYGLRLIIQESQATGGGDCLIAFFHGQLLVDMPHMGAHRIDADHHFVADLLVSPAARQQIQDLLFSCGQIDRWAIL